MVGGLSIYFMLIKRRYFDMSELINTESETSIGLFEIKDDTDVYVPIICWNLSIVSYVSDPDYSYRAYGCIIKIQSRNLSSIKSFKVYVKESDFSKFDRVWAAIVAQTHGT